MNLKINLGFAPPSMLHCTVMFPVTRWEAGEAVAYLGLKKLLQTQLGGVQGTSIKEMKLPFCLELCRGRIPLVRTIWPLTCRCVLCQMRCHLRPAPRTAYPSVPSRSSAPEREACSVAPRTEVLSVRPSSEPAFASGTQLGASPRRSIRPEPLFSGINTV